MAGQRWALAEAVRKRAVASGPVAQAWADGIDAVVADFERDWNLTVLESMAGGSEAFVGRAVTAGGTEAVLKIAMPDQNNAARAIAVFREAEGRGYARLYEADEARETMLLEMLGGPLMQSHLPASGQIGAILETLRQAWRRPRDASVFPTGADKARDMAAFIEKLHRQYAGRVSDRSVELAVAFCRRRQAAWDPDRAVMAHADGHSGNTLADPMRPGGWRFVDPEGLFIEPEYDLGILMRENPLDALDGDPLARSLARRDRLAAATGLDPEAIWEWGAIERLATGLFLEHLDLKDWAVPFLQVAEACTAA